MQLPTITRQWGTCVFSSGNFQQETFRCCLHDNPAKQEGIWCTVLVAVAKKIRSTEYNRTLCLRNHYNLMQQPRTEYNSGIFLGSSCFTSNLWCHVKINPNSAPFSCTSELKQHQHISPILLSLVLTLMSRRTGLVMTLTVYVNDSHPYTTPTNLEHKRTNKMFICCNIYADNLWMQFSV